MSSSSSKENTGVGAVFGYTFRDRELLSRALTHRSLREDSNERLEFLGDAVLSLVIAEYLFCEYRGVDEGMMTKMRVHVVRGEALSECAAQTELPGLIATGKGVRGEMLPSILADAAEAVFAAIYLDGGYDAARDVILRVMRPRIATVREVERDDPKSCVNEYFSARGISDIRYEDIGEDGPDHDKVFHVRLTVAGRALSCGSGHSKKQAQQNAASEALKNISDFIL